jgi:3-deoxy-7-phosphoheptulonate synthase
MSKHGKTPWNISSWRKYDAKQQPIYDDLIHLERVIKKLGSYPALIYFDEANRLKHQLAKICKGEAFLLQAGDCAESFAEFSESNLTRYFQILLQMTAVLMHGTKKPVVKVGRIAGQFAKPRSSDFEEVNGNKIASYRGDIVNSLQPSAKLRIPNPDFLVDAYKQSAATLNFLRSLATGGFSSIEKINGWLTDFAINTPENKKLIEIVERIKDSAYFFKACGFDLESDRDYNSAEFYTSHEALLLNYEEALTRKNPIDNQYYACSAHMLWIGERTRNLDGAHIEFFRGLANPIASKIGPNAKIDDILQLINALNPNNEPGKLTLITRMGANIIEEKLPNIIKAVQKEGFNVIWSCDPMHGNTEKSINNFKTRKFSNILAEVESFFNIHKALNSYAGGIHIEMTGQDVTECLGGSREVTEEDLVSRYKTHCDPRLNGSQSLELAFLIADRLNR